jgi:signal peptide peptidase SppA
MRYERILAAVAATPWAIEPNKGRELAALLSRRATGTPASESELVAAATARAASQSRKSKARPGGIAVIPLHGVMMQRADWFMEACGMLSTDQVTQLVGQAADDPSVEAIVLDVDSPGGSVFGTPELAAKVSAAAKQKKVIAVANSMAASAAYYVASQASEVVVTPGGMCGSIGVVMMHVDESKALEMAGQVVTVLATSDTKKGGIDPGPLSPAWKGHLESLMTGYFDQFVRAVADGRNVSQKKVKEEFGDGGVLLAEAAVRVGMADKVATLDDVLGRYGLSVADVSPGAVTLAAAEAGNIAPAAKSDALDVETRRRRMQMS